MSHAKKESTLKIGCIALNRWNMIVQIISRHMDRVVRDVIRFITLNRKDRAMISRMVILRECLQ